jgi:LEA14-like dessication related protein
MTTPWRRKPILVLLSITLLVLGCSKPEVPRILPRALRVTSVTPSQLGVTVELDVYNPNSFALQVRSAEGQLFTASGASIGTGRVTVNGGSVAAKSSSIVTGELGVKWTDLSALAALALTTTTVTYTFRGSANIGGDQLNVDVPFTLSGELTRTQLMQAGLSGLPSIPALQGLSRGLVTPSQ